MAQESLVVEQIDCGKDFVTEFHKFFPVDVSFWLNPANSDEWYLYVASAKINDNSYDESYVDAYRKVIELTSNHQYPFLEDMHIKLLGSGDSLAQKVIEIRDRRPLNVATRYNGGAIDGIPLGQSAYIYPTISEHSIT